MLSSTSALLRFIFSSLSLSSDKFCLIIDYILIKNLRLSSWPQLENHIALFLLVVCLVTQCNVVVSVK